MSRGDDAPFLRHRNGANEAAALGKKAAARAKGPRPSDKSAASVGYGTVALTTDDIAPWTPVVV
jgi:hypothetical protein